jgi:1-aminocyclopropane-1-carboxylate deaminase/D-cysteine desulfhydrase-like pyridoxal-dependent ACC family enzyme
VGRVVTDLTPVERRGDIWVKRDDLFTVAGISGGKVRTCWSLAQGARGLVTAGSRYSPQVNIVAQIARHLNIPCQVHVPSGELSPEVQLAVDAGADLVQHRPGYNTVIVARARAAAEALGHTLIPFGMECEDAVEYTSEQVQNVPRDAARIVVPVGSGMSMAGILTGLREHDIDIPVLGVSVGADPGPRLSRWAPFGWQSGADIVDVDDGYHVAATADWDGILLDPYYEAKVVPYLEPDDLLWIVGIRQSVGVLA